jgi:hypothetical protein
MHGVTLIKSGVRKGKNGRNLEGKIVICRIDFCGVPKSRDRRHVLAQGFMKI